MSNVLTEKATHCQACERELVHDICVNPDCPEAQATATIGASRKTAKETTLTTITEVARPAVQERPRSFERSGRVD